MKDNIYSHRLLELRESMGFSQKEFAAWLNIPQASLSAYENGRISPSMGVIVNVAKKCRVSADWLCGLTTMQENISSLREIAECIYALLDLNEIGIEINAADDQNIVSIIVDGNDRKHMLNARLYEIIRTIKERHADLESCMITKETYDLLQKRMIKSTDIPLTKKEYPELTRDELLKRRQEYLLSALRQ